MSNWKNIQTRKKAGNQDIEKGMFSGAYKAKIIQCVIQTYDGNDNYEALDMKVELTEKLKINFKEIPKPKKKDDNIFYDKLEKKYYKLESSEIEKIDEPKTYNIRKMVVVSSAGRDIVMNQGKISSALFLSKKDPKFTEGLLEANVYDFDLKEMVNKKVNQLTELVGKEIGVLIKMSHKFKNVCIDGYSNQELFSPEDKQGDTAIWMNNYDLQRVLEFNIDHFFDWKTHQTLHEIDNKENAKKVYQILHTIIDWSQPLPTPSEQDDERRKALKTKLSKARIAFEEYEFVGSVKNTSTSITESDEIDDSVPF